MKFEYHADSHAINYNGPAIWGGYGALFAVMVQILLSAGAIAVQV